jgi:hypothetical protein
MTEHHVFFSTPKFVSDLIHISEVLKGVDRPERNDMLKELLEQLNKNLPANVYIPIHQENIISSKFPNNKPRVTKTQILTHKVLKISTEHAFCLHSKERVPYHIIIEVAYEK